MTKNLTKYFVILSGVMLMCLDSYAQIPQGINYQAIVRNGATGLPVVNRAVTVRFEIDTLVSPGVTNRAYWEEHSTTTNDYGLINLVIGKNKIDSSGSFNTVPWRKLTWLRLMVDTNAGSAFTTIGTTQFFAVPYAMNAANVDKLAIATETLTITGDGSISAPLKQTDLGLGTGTSGSSSMIPVINYDTYGRILSISQTTITASPVLTNTLNIVGNGSSIPLDLSKKGLGNGKVGSTSYTPVISYDDYGRITQVDSVLDLTTVIFMDTNDIVGNGSLFNPYSLKSKSIGSGTVGSTNVIPVIGYDDKGRITSVSTASVAAVPIVTDTSFFDGDGTSASPLKLKSMGTGIGSVGSGSVIPVIDYDDYGRITNVDTVHLPQVDGVKGTGKVNHISKFINPITIGSSGLYENNIGNVMIGGTSPQSGLHIKKHDGLLSQGILDSGMISTFGSGVRMHWYPRKAAFRAGGVNSTQWDEINIGQYSVAMGENPTASGLNAIAFGESAQATAKDAIAMGSGSVANKSASFAFGGAVVNGDNSLGYGSLTNITSGTNNISLGSGNNSGTNASSAYILGQGNEVDATNVVSVGSNTITATNSGAFGASNDISGSGFSFAYGEKNIITDQFNYLLGINNEVKVGAKNVFLLEREMLVKHSNRQSWECLIILEKPLLVV